MSKLYDHSQKKYVDVPDSQVDDLVKSGKFTFAQDIRIPVVSPDGQIGDIDSKDAYEMFNQGYRWQTKTDRNIAYDEGMKNIVKERAADMPGTAFLGGALRGATLSGSDVIVRGLEEVGAIPKGVTEFSKQVEEQNPIMSTSGLILSSLPMGVGPAAVGAKAITGATGAALAAKGVGKLGQGIVAGAAEGAYWGLGQAVSETALGNPDDLVKNLVSNVGMGGLVGGAFGGAFEGVKLAKPLLQKASEATIGLGEKVVRGTAKGIVKGIAKPVMSIVGKGDEYRTLASIDDEVADLVSRGMLEEAEALSKTGVRPSTKTLAKESKALAREVEAQVKAIPKEMRGEIKQAIIDNGGDLGKTLYGNDIRLKDLGKAIDEHMITMERIQPAHDTAKLIKEVESTALKLKATKNPDAETVAEQMIARAKAYHHGPKSLGHETAFIKDVSHLSNTFSGAKNLVGYAKDAAFKLHDDMKHYLKTIHPDEEFRQSYEVWDKLYGANAELKKLIKKGTMGQKGGIKNFLFNQEVRDAAAPMLKNLKEFTPELEAIMKSGDDVVAKQNAFNQLDERLKHLRGRSIDSSTMPEFRELVEEVASNPRLLNNLDRIDQIQSSVQNIDQLNPVEATTVLYSLLGKDVKELDKFAKISQNWEKLQQLRGASKGGPSIGIGTLAATALGDVTGMVGALALQSAMNPLQTLKNIGYINRATKAGADRLKKAVEKTGRAILSNPVKQAVVLSKIQSDSKERRRERYKNITKTVADLSVPENMAAQLEQSAGHMTDIPQVKLAISMKLQASHQYLMSQLPQDPLAGSQIRPGKSPWEPSDQQVASYLRKVEAINDPVSVIERVGDGTVTPDQVAAIQEVHPEIYEQLQTGIMSAIMVPGADVPYERRIMLGNLFNIPSDYALNPEFIAKMQEPFASKNQGGRPSEQGQQPRKANIDINPFSTVATDVDRISYKDMQ